MSRLKLKICGMCLVENIREVAELHPDYMGFIFYDKSPRYVGEDFIVPQLPAGILKVGVFVNEDIGKLLQLAHRNKLDFVQLHGDESPEYCEKVKQQGLRIIKVFRVDDEFDFDVTADFDNVADYFLFDTKGKLYGGNAIAFDWDVLKKYSQKVPFFLSGGLQISNLNQLKKLNGLNLYAVDINSGVEDTPGMKNIIKIKEVINQLAL